MTATLYVGDVVVLLHMDGDGIISARSDDDELTARVLAHAVPGPEAAGLGPAHSLASAARAAAWALRASAVTDL